MTRFTNARGVFSLLALAAATPSVLLAHGVSAGDKGYIQETFGVRIVPFLYLGAKHMVTGYDHRMNWPSCERGAPRRDYTAATCTNLIAFVSSNAG